MTVVHPNHIVGINSITVATGDALSIHKNDGTLIRTIVNEASGVSTFASISASDDVIVGVSTLFVDVSTGRIGIGTDNPSCSLNVNGQIVTYDPTDGVSSSYGLVISPTSTGGTREAIITKSNSDLRIAAGSGAYQADRANILIKNSPKDVIINAATTSGGVGIGTDPAELLHIAGSSGITTARLRITDKSNSIAAATQYGVIQFEQRDSNTPGVSVEVAAVMQDTTNGATALQIKTGTPSTIAERARIDSSGRLLVNHNASVDQNAQIQSWTSGTDTFAGFKYGNNASPNIIRLGKTRNGSAGGATIVQEDDEVGRLLFQGNNGTDFKDCAAVQCYVDGEPGSSGDATDMPGRLILSTAADGASSLTERVRIDCTGAVGINQTNPNKAKLHVVGPGSATNEIIAKFKGGTGTDCLSRIGIVAGYSDTANDSEGHVFIGALRNGSGNQAHLSFETYNGSAVAERVRITSAGHLQPGADATYNLGSPSYRWANVYSADLQLSNEGSANEIDGSWGSYTIQEGETNLFLINRRNGKKYTFNLTEVS